MVASKGLVLLATAVLLAGCALDGEASDFGGADHEHPLGTRTAEAVAGIDPREPLDKVQGAIDRAVASMPKLRAALQEAQRVVQGSLVLRSRGIVTTEDLRDAFVKRHTVRAALAAAMGAAKAHKVAWKRIKKDLITGAGTEERWMRAGLRPRAWPIAKVMPLSDVLARWTAAQTLREANAQGLRQTSNATMTSETALDVAWGEEQHATPAYTFGEASLVKLAAKPSYVGAVAGLSFLVGGKHTAAVVATLATLVAGAAASRIVSGTAENTPAAKDTACSACLSQLFDVCAANGGRPKCIDARAVTTKLAECERQGLELYDGEPECPLPPPVAEHVPGQSTVTRLKAVEKKAVRTIEAAKAKIRRGTTQTKAEPRRQKTAKKMAAKKEAEKRAATKEAHQKVAKKRAAEEKAAKKQNAKRRAKDQTKHKIAPGQSVPYIKGEIKKAEATIKAAKATIRRGTHASDGKKSASDSKKSASKAKVTKKALPVTKTPTKRTIKAAAAKKKKGTPKKENPRCSEKRLSSQYRRCRDYMKRRVKW